MGVAHLSSFRSKDPNTQVGACIVNQDNRIVGVGYNGLPKGLEDNEFQWDMRNPSVEQMDRNKYAYVVHAEANAILNATKSVSGCRIYVSLFPCHECAKLIIQSGITEIVYEDDKYNGTPSDIASKKMLNAAHVTFRKVVPIEVTVKQKNN